MGEVSPRKCPMDLGFGGWYPLAIGFANFAWLLCEICWVGNPYW